MDFTVFSFAMAVVWTGIFAKLISILRKRMSVLQYFSVYPLLILLLFCILRIILPLELPLHHRNQIRKYRTDGAGLF